ncbi:MAG TPA: hypothetical protein VJ949_07070 [Cryomorphaceae bacterium]|nr:hypothetical protein [Cryomorphaceae bacterium]
MGEVRYNMIGPVDMPEETNSGLVLLPTNNTLLALPLKGENGPRKPEEVPPEFLESTADVMEYAQPEVKVNIKTGNPDNPESSEVVKFRGGVESFSPKAIKQNSRQLRKLQSEFQASETLIDRIDKNAQFRKALDDAEARNAIIASFAKILDELAESLPPTED